MSPFWCLRLTGRVIGVGKCGGNPGSPDSRNWPQLRTRLGLVLWMRSPWSPKRVSNSMWHSCVCPQLRNMLSRAGSGSLLNPSNCLGLSVSTRKQGACWCPTPQGGIWGNAIWGTERKTVLSPPSQSFWPAPLSWYSPSPDPASLLAVGTQAALCPVGPGLPPSLGSDV